jgi:hypothetical protein
MEALALAGNGTAAGVLEAVGKLDDTGKVVAAASYLVPLVFALGFYAAVLKRRSEPIGVVAPVSGSVLGKPMLSSVLVFAAGLFLLFPAVFQHVVAGDF